MGSQTYATFTIFESGGPLGPWGNNPLCQSPTSSPLWPSISSLVKLSIHHVPSTLPTLLPFGPTKSPRTSITGEEVRAQRGGETCLSLPATKWQSKDPGLPISNDKAPLNLPESPDSQRQLRAREPHSDAAAISAQSRL